MEIELDLPALRQTTLQYKIPKELPIPPPDDESRKTAEALLSDFSVQDAIASADINEMWSVLSACSEAYIAAIAKRHHPGLRLDSGHLGRGLRRDPTLREVSSPTLKDATGGASHAQIHLRKNQHRIRHVLNALAKLDGPGCLTRDLEKTVCKIRKECGIMKIPFPDGVDLSTLLPSVDRMLQERISRLDINARKARERHREMRLNQDFDSERRSISQWCKGKTKRELDVLKGIDGGLTASVEEMDTIMHKAWEPIFRLYDKAPPPVSKNSLRSSESSSPPIQWNVVRYPARGCEASWTRRKPAAPVVLTDGGTVKSAAYLMSFLTPGRKFSITSRLKEGGQTAS